jgi:drug/metabolite transporter (DMT)-like permease|tara:strand:- start:2653 stop:3579 length:927 start_codon:yes stop_codon:yes gene_type:complete
MHDVTQSRYKSGAWPYVLLIAASFILATNHIVGRTVQGSLPPMGLGFWRIIVASAVLLPFYWKPFIESWPVIRRHWKLFLVMGAALAPFGNASVYLAYNFTSAINGGIVATVQPVATVVLSYFLLSELINKIQAIGVLVAATGVLVILSAGNLDILLSFKPNIGDLIMLAAMFGFAVHNVLLRRLPKGLSGPVILLGVQLFGAIVIFPIYVVEMIVYKPIPYTAEALGTIIWIGVVVGVFAVGFTNSAVLSLGPNKASMSNYFRAVFTTVLAILVLGENLQLFHGAAFLLVFAGIFLMGHQKRHKTYL